MHDDRRVIEARIDRTLRERIRPAVYPHAVPLAVHVWHVPGEPVPVAEGLRATYAPAAVGDAWGPPWGTSWFRFTGEVPAEWAGRTVEAVLDLGFSHPGPGFSAEGLVYRPDGSPVKGLHPKSHWVRLTERTVDLYVEAAANPLIVGPVTALGDPLTAGDAPLYRLARADVAIFDETVWNLAHDLDVLVDLMRQQSLESPRRWEILRACERALDVLDLFDLEATAAAAREKLAPALALPAHPDAHTLYSVGHAHIDSAWLWPLRETVRKVARTAANVVSLMDDDPDVVFAMSQAQQLAWIKEHRPEIFTRVKERIADGRLVPVGGMWVEADANMPGGEAMARQFVHGKRFFLDEFGIETEEVWLPDSFGYSAALPQLIKLSGSKWFLTQKISWNETNKFPHHTFWWEGLDGTRIFTHFPPVDTYNVEFSGKQLAHAVANFEEKGAASRSLAPFGYGDGGGGPTRDMMARARRLANLAGSPRVRIAAPARFFEDAHTEYPDAPVWVGELYLELHRGTYTSQAKTKQGNRRSEHLLREAELWAATAAVRAGFAYPYERLDRLWKTVLLHQFHDILPGSSIAWVHRQARTTYADVAAELGEIIDSAQESLSGAGEGVVVFNAAPHGRNGVPAGGAHPEWAPAEHSAVEEADGGYVLDDGLLRVVVDARGLITSVVADGREAVAPGSAANLLQLHPDHPANWDAWDVNHYYRNTGTDLVDLVSMEARDGAVVVRRAFGASTVEQVVSVADGTVEIDTVVDWHEREKILKAAFPLDVRADRSASETQFGHVYRATHRNTSWEAARFEICAHRWVHVGEPGWGAAVVNDSTYGHDVTSTVRDDGGTTTTVRLSLLRAPRFPDPETDQGEHRFRYALVPGATIGDAVRAGYRINLPARRQPGNAVVEPLVAVDNDAVVVEAVKLADDGSGDVVVRLYEALGGRASARLTVDFPLAAAAETDLLERVLTPSAREGGTVAITLRPFQVVTLRLTPGN
ncbi:alpha-mannosidase [Virgisporangium ochraceum]|uniref:Alpha-mannosidase n=1 Tax=Virgisporangium ochraceum TaxID=65505 RepID=A0A8J3ZWK5_9ACTN|nr:glycoside hydrolase family 38 C-terminal domain-containing protein [Virgisporangium ochraceum]GIJ69780.1 alpha-mannosidase [Virgisporangium ochraceum]